MENVGQHIGEVCYFISLLLLSSLLLYMYPLNNKHILMIQQCCVHFICRMMYIETYWKDGVKSVIIHRFGSGIFFHTMTKSSYIIFFNIYIPSPGFAFTTSIVMYEVI